MSAVDSAVKSRGPETTAPPVSSKDFHGHSDRPRGFFSRNAPTGGAVHTDQQYPKEPQCEPATA
jgi:hypothetical protein